MQFLLLRGSLRAGLRSQSMATELCATRQAPCRGQCHTVDDWRLRRSRVVARLLCNAAGFGPGSDHQVQAIRNRVFEFLGCQLHEHTATLQKHSVIRPLPTPTINLWDIALTPSGDRVVVSPGADAPTVRILDASAGTTLFNFEKQRCFGITFDPHSETLAIFGQHGSVQLLPTRPMSKTGTNRAIRFQDNRRVLPTTPYQKHQSSLQALLHRKTDLYAEALETINEVTRIVPDCPEYKFTRVICFSGK